MEFISA
jgi:ABC-type dipeptide/oligopeptide/nickel transport system ATPase subunit